MDVVIRPVGDKFLKEVAYPAFEVGMVDATAGLEQLRGQIQDAHTLTQIEILLDQGVEGSFFSLNANQWLDVVYRLLFHEWKKSRDGGWVMGSEYLAYAGSLENTLHLTLMLEEPRYPYTEPPKAKELRTLFIENPEPHFGLASLVAGSWHPVPAFAPDQVVSITGRGMYSPQEDVAYADWTHRPAATLKVWKAQLAQKLQKLIEREERRLHPVDIPEKYEILQYWNGNIPEPPYLAVAFSGLGPEAHGWIREIGTLAQLVRNAASHDQGLTAIISAPMKAMGAV